jgi:RNA polymerase sigma factor (sigma-70 family)
LVRLAFLLTGLREHSEDVVHAVFASAMSRWDLIEQPLAYLKRAVVNQTREVHRHTMREPRREPAEGTTQIPEIDETWLAIQQLPLTQRMVIVLRFYEDLSLATIAELLSRPPATVRSDLKRALDRLRKVMTQ